MNHRSLHYALLLACGASGMASAAETPPLRPYVVVYDFSTYGFTAGTVALTLRQDSPDTWSYISTSQPHGVFRLVRKAARTVTSRMLIDQRGVRPVVSTDTQTGDSAPQSEVHFDWAANRATGTVEGQVIDMELRPGVQDDLSAQIALIQLLSAGQTPASFSVFDKNGIRDYGYTRAGTETLHTPLGDVATIIYRSQRAAAPRSTRYWCAPALGFIPMRVEQRRLDKVEWTMDIRSLQRN